MIIDLPPQTAQAIIEIAKAQGLSIEQLLNKTFIEPVINEQELFLDSDLIEFNPTLEQANTIQDLLDNPPPLSNTARAFLLGHNI